MREYPDMGLWLCIVRWLASYICQAPVVSQGGSFSLKATRWSLIIQNNVQEQYVFGLCGWTPSWNSNPINKVTMLLFPLRSVWPQSLALSSLWLALSASFCDLSGTVRCWLCTSSDLCPTFPLAHLRDLFPGCVISVGPWTLFWFEQAWAC